MVRAEEAEQRLFANIWICMKCTSKQRATPGKKPARCRKCKSKRLRLKRKAAKKVK